MDVKSRGILIQNLVKSPAFKAQEITGTSIKHARNDFLILLAII